MAEEAPGEGNGAAARQRIVFVGAMLVTALIVGGALLLSASDDVDASAGPPEECVTAWNQDSRAQGIGSHGASAHGYTRAWVLYLGDDFEPGSDDEGSCAVVFPSEQLDPEPFFAASIEDGEGWRPLKEATEISDERLAELQFEAISFGNAQVLPDGSLAAL